MVKIHLLRRVLHMRRHYTFLEVLHQDWCTVASLVHRIRRIRASSPILLLSGSTIDTTSHIMVIPGSLATNQISRYHSYSPLRCHLLVIIRPPMSSKALLLLIRPYRIFLIMASSWVEVIVVDVLLMINLTGGFELLAHSLHLISKLFNHLILMFHLLTYLCPFILTVS